MTTLPRRTDLSPEAARTTPARRRAAAEIARCATWTEGPRWRATGVRCVRRPGNTPCRGRIEVRCADDELAWACPRCGDHGSIVGWEGGEADLRPAAREIGAPAGSALVDGRAHDDLRAIAHGEPGLHPLVSSARPLRGGRVEFDVWASSGDECRRAVARHAAEAPTKAVRARLEAVAAAIGEALAPAGSDAAGRPGGRTYRLRVDLRDVQPPIWRRVLVPAEVTLAGLHEVLQAAMGWRDAHLYGFRRGERLWAPAHPELPSPHPPTSAVPLSSVLQRPKDRLLYMYDFGDAWEHEVTLEEIAPEPCPRARCIDGRRAGPPEDCGGVHGYGEVLAAVADPEHPMREWVERTVGAGFDPEWFDAEETDSRVARVPALARRPR